MGEHEARPHGAGPPAADDPFRGAAAAREPFAGGLRAAVITASDRAAAGEYADEAGPVAAERLRTWGFRVEHPHVVADGEPVAEAVRAALDTGARVILTVGGTGVSPSDLTPEVTEPLLDRRLPGICEAVRAVGVARGIPASILSRGVAGMAGECLVANLPGSKGAVRDGLDVLAAVLPHLVSQAEGSGVPHAEGGRAAQ